MFRQPRPNEVEEPPSFTKGERVGSAIAHASPLFATVPMFWLWGDIAMALVPSPIVAYIISRSFRRRQSAWGAFQGMQATIAQLILVILAFIGALLSGLPASDSTPVYQIQIAAFVGAFLLFLYTLWGAWDCAFGYDFRYIFISNFVDRITEANLKRQERRQQRNNLPR